MGTITAYSISVAIILAIEYIVYKSLLANSTFHRFNRFVLMACYVIALTVVPLCHLVGGQSVGIDTVATAGNVTFEAPAATFIGTAPAGTGSALWKAVPVVYIAGVVAMAVMTIVSYARMLRVIRAGEHRRRGDVTIVVSDTKVSPFSWGKYIVVSPEDADNETIIAHEMAHINNRDSVDLLFAQLFIIFNWFNPAAYLVRRELSAVHEYEVDRLMLDSGIRASDYQMLLIKKTAGLRFQSIANSLNHSQLKNRLTMMLKSKSRRGRSLLAAALVPAALLAVSMTNLPAVASTIRNVAAVSYDKVSENNAPLQEAAIESTAAQPAADENDRVYASAQQLPQYEGGMKQLMTDLANEVKYPEKALADGVSGRVVVKFVVNTDGSMSDFEVVRSQSEELDAEAIRAIKSIKGKWTPGKENGKAVRCMFTLPVSFALESDTTK